MVCSSGLCRFDQHVVLLEEGPLALHRCPRREQLLAWGLCLNNAIMEPVVVETTFEWSGRLW